MFLKKVLDKRPSMNYILFYRKGARMSKEIVKVLFRKDRAGDFKGSITAIFPESWKDNTWTNPGNVAGYVHVGQHCECSFSWYRENTVKARPEEYAELFRELKSIYEKVGDCELKVVQKMNYNRPTIKREVSGKDSQNG
jgi:hypothetical protein